MSDTLKSRLDAAVKDAMRAREKERLTTLRLITAAIKQIEVDTREEVTDEGVLQILGRMTKQRRESIEQYKSAGRDDLAAQEAAELEIIAEFLPTPLTDDEVAAIVDEAIAESGASSMQEMGKVMGLVKARCEGRADLGAVSALVRSKLG